MTRRWLADGAFRLQTCRLRVIEQTMNTALNASRPLVPTSGLARSFDATIICDLPQTKPTSANEANSKKISKNNVGR
jgi:hypothetical protein